MLFVRRKERQEVQDRQYVAGLRRSHGKNFKKYRQPVREPFRTASDKKAVLRQRREHHLPEIKAFDEILRARKGDRSHEVRGKALRREGRAGSRGDFAERRQRESSGENLRSAC